MLSEDTLKLIQMRRNPVNSLQDLDKKLIGTREGFIFYTTSFRKDFDTKMSMLGRLEQENKQLQQENQQLKSVIKEIREYIQKNKLYTYKYDEEELFEITTDEVAKTDLLQILDKGDK